MKFEVFLEGMENRKYDTPRHKVISENEAGRFIERNNQSTMGTPIYRGRSSNDPFIYINTKNTKERMAANTKNYVNLLVSNLPEWNKFPKRNKSITATASKKQATMYAIGGIPYQIFPKNQTKMGVSPHRDFWIFKGFNVMELNQMIHDLIEFDSSYETNYKKLENFLKNTDPVHIENDFIDNNIYYKIIQQENLYDAMRYILDPHRNGFYIAPIGSSMPINHEVWFEGECVMVRYDMLDKLERYM